MTGAQRFRWSTALGQERGGNDRLWQLRVAVSNAAAVRRVLLILAGLTVALLIPRFSLAAPLAWGAAVGLWALTDRYVTIRWVRPGIAPETLARTEAIICLSWGLGMTIWALAGVLFWGESDAALQGLMLVLTGIAAISVGFLVSPCRALAFTASLPFALLWIWFAHRPDGSLHMELLFIVGFYVLAIFTLTGHFYRHGRHALQLAQENALLVGQINSALVDAESARKRAETANEAKSTFLANMSHEIRTPLNAILGFSEIIRDEVFGPAGNERYRDYASDIYRSGSHLLAVVNDILDLARIEAGEREIQSRRIEVGKLLESVMGLFDVTAREGGVILARQLTPGLPELWADDRSIRQIMINLVANAIRFTPPGGRVTLAAALAPDGGLSLRVTDTGAGISEEDLARVTQRFAQGVQDQASRQRGTGLGLAIVEELGKVHGARFVLRSQLGKGTHAEVNFPPERTFVLSAGDCLPAPRRAASA